MTEVEALGCHTVHGFGSQSSSCSQNSLQSCWQSFVRKKQRMGDARALHADGKHSGKTPFSHMQKSLQKTPATGELGSELPPPVLWLQGEVNRHPEKLCLVAQPESLCVQVLAESFPSSVWLPPFCHSGLSLNVTSSDIETYACIKVRPLCSSPSNHSLLFDNFTLAAVASTLKSCSRFRSKVQVGWALVCFAPPALWCWALPCTQQALSTESVMPFLWATLSRCHCNKLAQT